MPRERSTYKQQQAKATRQAANAARHRYTQWVRACAPALAAAPTPESPRTVRMMRHA